MKTSSVGSAIDDLVRIGVAAFPPSTGVEVADGPWDQATAGYPQLLLAIGLPGLDGDGDTAVGVQQPRRLSQPLEPDEDYTITNLVFVQTGATDPAAQKKVRDQAEAMLAVYETALRTSANLPQGSPLIGGAWVENVRYVQVDQTIPGRFCRIHFDIHVRNVLLN